MTQSECELAGTVSLEVKPGDPLTKVQKVADRYIDGAGVRKWVWWVGGYALSQSVPPDWVGTHFVDPHEGVADQLLNLTRLWRKHIIF